MTSLPGNRPWHLKVFHRPRGKGPNHWTLPYFCRTLSHIIKTPFTMWWVEVRIRGGGPRIIPDRVEWDLFHRETQGNPDVGWRLTFRPPCEERAPFWTPLKGTDFTLEPEISEPQGMSPLEREENSAHFSQDFGEPQTETAALVPASEGNEEDTSSDSPVYRSSLFHERKAEKIFKHEMIHKDFWIVDSVNNNLYELEDVLNTLFNDESKGLYTAEIVNNQNNSRLVIKCTVCNTQLSSYDPFMSHNSGKNHKKAVQQFLSRDQNHLHNLMGPIVHKKLSEMEGEFELESLEEQLFSTKHIVLGWQFVYREIINGEQLYTCQLCSRGKGAYYKMNQKQAFDHLTHESHVLNYMKVKFHRQGTFDQLFEEIQEVQTMEGKIQYKIITLKANMEKPFSFPASLSSRRSREDDIADVTQSPSTSSSSSVRQRHSSSSSRPRTPDRKVPLGRPKTPPSPKKVDKACQMDPPEHTMTEFMQDLARHYQNMYKKGDDLTEELKKDLEGQDLLIQTVKVLSQKIYLYSLTPDIENDFQQNATGLLKKTEHLRLLHDSN